MRRVKRIIATMGLLGLIFVAVPASAQSSNITGGNAADYQPPTGNPQNNTTTNLQTTGSGLQPVPGQSNFTQEKLTGATDLQVVGMETSEPNTNTTSTESTDITTGLNPVPFIVIGLLTFAGVLYVATQPSGSAKTSFLAEPVAAEAAVKPEPLPSTKKPLKKKHTARKSTRRSAKRKK